MRFEYGVWRREVWSVSWNAYLFRRPGGSSFLPTSVAGFIQAKMRKLGCRCTGSISPRSVKYKLPPSSSPLRLSRVSVDAKLALSEQREDETSVLQCQRPESISRKVTERKYLIQENPMTIAHGLDQGTLDERKCKTVLQLVVLEFKVCERGHELAPSLSQLGLHWLASRCGR